MDFDDDLDLVLDIDFGDEFSHKLRFFIGMLILIQIFMKILI